MFLLYHYYRVGGPPNVIPIYPEESQLESVNLNLAGIFRPNLTTNSAAPTIEALNLNPEAESLF